MCEKLSRSVIAKLYARPQSLLLAICVLQGVASFAIIAIGVLTLSAKAGRVLITALARNRSS